jgi:alkylhydroperoxidase family enzyme
MPPGLVPYAGCVAPTTSTSTWLPVPAGDGSPFERAARLRPAYASAMAAVHAALWDQDVLELETLELCRLRIAQLLGAESTDAPFRARAVPVADDRRANLTRWPTAPHFTGRERACLGHAEQLLIDAQGVTDEDAARLIQTIGEPAFLLLTYACGVFETTARAHLLLTAGEEP